MPRRYLIRSSVRPYHIVNRVNNREWFQYPMPETWALFSSQCYEITHLMDARIHAAVLMSNHFHMLVTTPGPDLGEVMQFFSSSLTRTFNLKTGREGHLFNGRYRWTLIDTPIYYAHAQKYVYRNPVKAGIVERVEDYPWSTLHGKLGRSHLPFPLYYPENGAGDELIAEDSTQLLEWLNTPFASESDEAVRKALRRKVFRFPKTKAVRRLPIEESLV